MKLRPFELGLVIVFAGLAFTAIIMLRVIKPAPADTELGFVVGNVEIWGVVQYEVMNPVLEELGRANASYEDVTYTYVREEDFRERLKDALSEDWYPDLVIMPHEMLVSERTKLSPVPYTSYPLVDYRDRYIDGAEIFALDDGIYAYPLAVDPLMMYWNGNILSDEGFLSPPETWESLINSYFPKIIKRDFDRTIQRSVVAMGEYGNVRNSFGMISALLLQGGSEMVSINSNKTYQVSLSASVSNSGDPFDSAVDFYTRFGKSENSLYSWNSSLVDDRTAFISEDLAFYFGYGSEGAFIEKINPNLNFNIAEVPQGSSETIRRTYGSFYGISVLAKSVNPKGAWAVMNVLAGTNYADQIAISTNMVPAGRSSIAAGSNDDYGRLNYKAAPSARAWLSPGDVESDKIFSAMIDDISANRRDVSGAVKDANKRLVNEYTNNN